MACHGFSDLIGDGRDSGIVDGNGIEWLKVVDKVQGTALLFDAEPLGVV